MALKKAKPGKRSVKREVLITVKVSALGHDNPFEVTLRAGSSVGDLVESHLPPSWNRENIDVAVNEQAREATYLLNDGDLVTFVPKVTGG